MTDVPAGDGRRVVIASRLFPPEPGAAAYRLGALARALSATGARVTVITTRPPRRATGEGPDRLRQGSWTWPGVRVRRWPVLRDSAGAVRGYVQFASYDWPLALRLLVARRPDVVVVEPPPTTGTVVRLVCALRRIPYVYYAADVSSTAAAGIGVAAPIVAVLRRVERWVMRGATAVMAVSDGVVREVVELGVDPQRVTLVGTGVDTDEFCPAQDDEPDETPAAQTLVYAGTMSEIQGADVFVRAFALVAAEFPQATLVMLGAGAEAGPMRSMAELLIPGRVRFEGLVPAFEVARALQRADVGLASVRPSRGYDFAFPTKMFVSTACGTPVVYAGVGPGRQMVVDNALGWAADWDADQVADAMREALQHKVAPAEAARLVEWTRENASLNQVGAVAAACVLGAAGLGAAQRGQEPSALA